MEKSPFIDPAHLLKYLPSHLNVGFILTDQSDRLVYADDFIQSICHIELSTLLQQNFLELPRNLFKFMRYVYQTGKSSMRPQHFEGLPLSNAEHARYYLSGLMLPLSENNQFTGMLCALRDVTDQINVEQKLVLTQAEMEKTIQQRTQKLLQVNRTLENQALTSKIKERELLEVYSRYKQLCGQVGEGFCRLTPDGMFLEANTFMADLLGYASVDAIKGHKGSFANQHFVEKSHWEYLVQKLLKEKIVHRLEVQLLTPAGPIWAEFTAILINTRWNQQIIYLIRA